MGDFTNLAVWQSGHELVLAIYQTTSKFPSDERFALSIQLRRAALSITSNVAEGCGRNTPRELAHFVRIALGSANEVRNQLLVARDLGYITAEQWRSLDAEVQRVKRMLSGLERSVRESTPNR